ncbi:MAG: SDR family oxidoreductase [Paludibacteraceae bacterium]|nr:SDR family oxidoreductase [Paludibacteraceae bacterium]
MKQVVVLTGGSSGIGKAAATLFAAKGWAVYELSRSGQSAAGVTHIACDVTDEMQVRQAVAEVLAKESRVDVLLSNAGFGISGAVEFTDTADAKRQFDVNFFGSLNVVKAVLPAMRSRHSGRIVFTSSVAAVLSIPYQAFYSASKSAINALALALRNEVAEFGITVTAVMPGDVSTGFTDARSKSLAGGEVYTHMQRAVEAMEKDERGGMTCDYLAQQLYRAATVRNPKPLYTAGFSYRIFVVLEKLLPKRLSNWIVGKLYS